MKKTLITLFGVAIIGNAQAAISIILTEVGSDVVATYSGTVNITDLGFPGSGSISSYIDSGDASIAMGSSASAAPYTVAFTSKPANFGTSLGFASASSFSGDGFDISSSFNYLAVPAGYVSNTFLSGSATWAGQTFASLALTPGSYTWTWGSGPNADSATLQIPEPSSAVFAGIASGAFLLRRRRK